MGGIRSERQTYRGTFTFYFAPNHSHARVSKDIDTVDTANITGADGQESTACGVAILGMTTLKHTR